MTGPPGPCGCGCALTPGTSIGFEHTRFAERILHHPDDPWQRWAKIHAGELLYPGGPQRFRYRLILAARQNGKSEIVVGLVPYWMFVDRKPQMLVTSTKVPMAKKLWKKSLKVIRSSGLSARLDQRWYREANGEVEMWTPLFDRNGNVWDSHYGIDASNEEGGRSLSVDELMVDELRHHYDYLAWGALKNTMGAIEEPHAWLLSNAGSDRSIVLNDLRDAAVTTLPDGTEFVAPDPDTDFFLAEYSAPPGSSPDDIYALAQANPNMNRRGQKSEGLLKDARRAMEAGGKALAEFQTEVMCIRVKVDNPAMNRDGWRMGNDPAAPAATGRTAAVLDVSPDQQHAALVGAAVLPDDRVRVKVIKVWTGVGCADRAWRELPEQLAVARPAAFGWFPAGPGAAGAAAMVKRPGWPPRGIRVEPLKAETPAVCMGFAVLVDAGKVVHTDDSLLNDQVTGVEWATRGEGKVFVRAGHANVAYAAAGAVHLARTLPAPPRKGRLIVAD